MTLELYLRGNGDRSLPYGIVGSLTSITMELMGDEIRAGQQISYRIYAREYNEPNIM